MNPPNPLVPQGSLETQSKRRSNVHIAILTIISIHAVFFAGLLMQGCRRDESKPPLQSAEAATNENTLPPLESEYYPATQDTAQSAGPTLLPAAPVQQLPPESGPAVLSPAARELPSEGKTYTIVKGDTMSGIAKLNGVTLSALKKANPGVAPSKLKPGSQIQIPAGGSATAQEPGVSESSSVAAQASSGTIYRVRPGETLSRIARKHGVSVQALRAANNLTSDRIRAGQKLRLPDASSTAPTSKLTAAGTAFSPSGTYAR